MKELVEILAAMTAKKAEVSDQRELFSDVAERIVKHVSASFAAKGDEVAILILTADGRHLRFAAPRKLADLGTIPVTKRDSIAVNVLTKQAGEVMNNVPLVRHVAFFESVKLREKAVPIQKMITVPIFLKKDVIGVAQISRKGETPAEAGPDFTQSDLNKAQELFQAVAPYLLATRPDKF